MTTTTKSPVRRDEHGNLTTDSTGQPLPQGAKSDATSWRTDPAGGRHSLPDGEGVRGGGCGVWPRPSHGLATGLTCTRGHSSGPCRGGTGGQNLAGEWGIEVEPEPAATTRIRVVIDNRVCTNAALHGTHEIVVPLSREEVIDYRDNAGWIHGDAVRSGLADRLNVSPGDVGWVRDSIEILPAETHELARGCCDDSTSEAAKIQAEFDAFKKKVAEVGERYAIENDFCSIYDELIAELGLERPGPQVVEFDVHLKVRVRAQLGERVAGPYDLDGIESSVKTDEILQRLRHDRAQGNLINPMPLLNNEWISDSIEILSVVAVEVDNLKEVK